MQGSALRPAKPSLNASGTEALQFNNEARQHPISAETRQTVDKAITENLSRLRRL